MPPGPRRSLRDYVADRLSQLSDLGGIVTGAHAIEFGTGDATITGRVMLESESSRGMLTVFEHLRVIDGRPRRWKYGYRLWVNGEQRVGYDRDPTGHPEMPEHKHVFGAERERIPWQRVTLHEVGEEIWTFLRSEH